MDGWMDRHDGGVRHETATAALCSGSHRPHPTALPCVAIYLDISSPSRLPSRRGAHGRSCPVPEPICGVAPRQLDVTTRKPHEICFAIPSNHGP